MVRLNSLIQVISNELEKSHQSLSIHLSFPQVEKTFNKFHKETCNEKILKTEKLIATDKNGKKIYQNSDNSQNSVSLDNDKLIDLYEKYGELFITHNHPRGEERIFSECLSSEDVISLFRTYESNERIDDNGNVEKETYPIKSVSCESPNGSRMTLTRGDHFKAENEPNMKSLGKKLEQEYMNYMEEMQGVRRQIMAEGNISMKNEEGRLDLEGFHEKLDKETLKRMPKFEETPSFKTLQKEFRENDCMLTMDYPEEYQFSSNPLKSRR